MRNSLYRLPITLLAALFAVAAGSLALAVAVIATGDFVWMRVMNGALPALAGSACLFAGYRLAHKRPLALWTPIPWFLAAWSIYYGLGPLVYVFGTSESVAYMDNLYAVDDESLLRTNVLNVVGLMAVLGGMAIVARIRFTRRGTEPVGPHHHDPWRVALLFLAIGVPVKYLFELPYVLGLVDYVLPGTIQYLGTFSGFAILPLTVAAHEGRRIAKLLLWPLILAEIGVGFVMLAKLHIIKTVLLVFLGQYAVRPDVKRLVLAGVIVVVAYVTVLSPFVSFARVILGRSSAESVAQVVEASQVYRAEGNEALAEILPGVQSWWTRLAYANAQAFAMDQYDGGKPGWTFAMAGYVFLPRFLLEDKPIMTPGVEYTRLIQGTDTSSTGLGFIGEAYWNGGWPLVITTGLFVGGLFAFLGHLAVGAVRRQRWLYVPLIFQVVYLGLRPDDWFVPSFIGGVLQVLVVVALLSGVVRPLVLRESLKPPKGPGTLRDLPPEQHDRSPGRGR